MTSTIWEIIFAFIVFSILDIAFISLNMGSFNQQMKDVQGSSNSLKIGGAVSAYILLFFGLYWFILREQRSYIDAAILGGVINGVYETTNYTFLKNWHLDTVIKDTLWGSVLWGFTVWITYFIFEK